MECSKRKFNQQKKNIQKPHLWKVKLIKQRQYNLHMEYRGYTPTLAQKKI